MAKKTTTKCRRYFEFMDRRSLLPSTGAKEGKRRKGVWSQELDAAGRQDSSQLDVLGANDGSLLSLIF
jgi:hypothetical protein